MDQCTRPLPSSHGWGYGYLNVDGKVMSTLHDDRPAAAKTRRTFGVGYFGHGQSVPGAAVNETVYAPFGNDPVLIHDVTITNTSARPRMRPGSSTRTSTPSSRTFSSTGACPPPPRPTRGAPWKSPSNRSAPTMPPSPSFWPRWRAVRPRTPPPSPRSSDPAPWRDPRPWRTTAWTTAGATGTQRDRGDHPVRPPEPSPSGPGPDGDPSVPLRVQPAGRHLATGGAVPPFGRSLPGERAPLGGQPPQGVLRSWSTVAVA